MNVNRRSQVERSTATRAALVAAARELWAARGYADVGTPEIARAAGVTRGAMYHQFADKAALFLAVVEAVEQEVTQRMAEGVAASGATDPAEVLRAVTEQWLDVAQEPEVHQIVLSDGPVVLGWAGFRDVALKYGLGLTEQLLEAAMGAGRLPRLPTRTLAHVFIGALDEAALLIAMADEPRQARAEASEVLQAMLDGMLIEQTAEG